MATFWYLTVLRHLENDHPLDFCDNFEKQIVDINYQKILENKWRHRQDHCHRLPNLATPMMIGIGSGTNGGHLRSWTTQRNVYLHHRTRRTRGRLKSNPEQGRGGDQEN